MSQYRLAKQSGISKQMLSRLELGTRQPSWETVQRLAKALGVDCHSFVDPDLAMPVGETAIQEERKAGFAKNADMSNGQPAFQQERSRDVVSDIQEGAEEATSAFGDRPASSGESVDIHIALGPELAGLVQWFEANHGRLPQEQFLIDWWKCDDPKAFYERCEAACEAIKSNNPTPDSPQWLQCRLHLLRERLERRL